MRDALENALLLSRRFRALLAHRLHGWTFMIALGLVAAALVLLVDGDAVAGICVALIALVAIWLGGVWTWPWGVDRYVRKISEVLQEGSREANTVSNAGHASLRKLRVMIKEMEPSLDSMDIHREITERMDEMDSLEACRGSESLADRAIHLNIIRSDLISALKRLATDHSDYQNDRLAELVDRLLLGIVDTRRATEAPLREMSERLRKMIVPRGLRDRHYRCDSAVSTYLVALKRFNDAREGEDTEAIREAAQGLSVRQVAMEELTNEYVGELRAIYQGRVPRHFDRTEADSC